MFVRRVLVIMILTFFVASAAGCSKRDRLQLKQAKASFKAGNMKNAVNDTNQLLASSPRNLFAKRLMKKIEAQLIKQVQEDLDAERYSGAEEKIKILLSDVHSQSEQVKALEQEVKKQTLAGKAQEALGKDAPGQALKLAKEALAIDPNFEKAKKIKEEAAETVQKKIANLMVIAQKLIAQKKFKELQAQANDILSIDSENREAAALLREAQVQLLAQSREDNLRMAKKFFEQGIYESAKERAEKVLKVDPNSREAKKLVENSIAEMRKPKIRLTGFTKIKGMKIAHLEIPNAKGRERFLVKEGEQFGPFKVSAIDLDLKAVVVTYTKTGSQQTLSLREQ